MNPLRTTILVLAGVAAMPIQAQPQQPSLDEVRESMVPYARATDAISLPDGRQLAFVCMGEGSPTVILTPGGGVPAFSWGMVQPAMAKTTRVCAWDRPGWGLSDGTSGRQTVATTTADLEAALATGRIPGPYVLVGHSLGAYESLLFADRQPKDTAGMVLVDPSIPDQYATLARIAPHQLSAGEEQQEQMFRVFRTCAQQIRSGELRAGGPDPNNCVTYPAFFPEALQQALAAKVTGSPLQYESQVSFISGFAESSRLVVNPQRRYGDMPLIVLTATVQPPPRPGTAAEQPTESTAWSEEWDRAHDELAALSTRGVNARVPGADHNIQSTKPQVVIDAVEAVVAEVRAAAATR
jgi:pimeloyl-ACP methyl ester carboxylesterase